MIFWTHLAAFAQERPSIFSPAGAPELLFSASAASSPDDTDTQTILTSDPSEMQLTYPHLFASATSSCATGSCYKLLPHDLLYRSYIAAPHEPRMSSAVLYDLGANSWRWDSTLGGRIGLLRRYNPTRMQNLDAWQIDLEGAVIVRLDPQEQMDLESSDYRFGVQWTGKRDNVAFKFGYFHVSSHVGDEYLVRNPTFDRINYVRESLVLGTAYQASPEWKVYGEVAWGFIATGGAKPFQLQYGAEYARIAETPLRGAPFAAVNLQHRQEADFAGGVNVMSGWQWQGPESGRAFRIGLQYFNGPSNQYQFYTRHDNQFGLGVWFDY